MAHLKARRPKAASIPSRISSTTGSRELPDLSAMFRSFDIASSGLERLNSDPLPSSSPQPSRQQRQPTMRPLGFSVSTPGERPLQKEISALRLVRGDDGTGESSRK